MGIIFLEPVFKQMIWGGSRLKTVFGYDIPGNDTGECWAISAHPNGDCLIKSGGYAGMTLSALWENHRELFGNAQGAVFPLLTKIIDAKEDLSIQVHPDDAYAKQHENGSFGKTECWYVLDCDENATIIIGHHAQSKEELKNMIDKQKWKDLIREVPVRKGDFFQITPGCIHAIKGGTLILETQQNSDITYRLYDYDRLSNGKKRELHIEKSIDVIEVPYQEKKSSGAPLATPNHWFKELINCDHYIVWKGTVDGETVLTQDRLFMLVSVIEGSGYIGQEPIKMGDHFILPFGYGEQPVKGKFTVICSSVQQAVYS